MEKHFEVVVEFINADKDVVDFSVLDYTPSNYDEAVEFAKKEEVGHGEQVAVWECDEDGNVLDSWVIVEEKNNSEYVVDGVDTRTSEEVDTIYVVTYIYDDDVEGVSAYSNVFKELDNAVADASIAQSEFTDGWDENSFDEEHYEEADGIGTFFCKDDNGNYLEISITRSKIR